MRAILTVVAAALLTGCGLKDDLYLPESERGASASEASASDPARDDDDDDASNP